MPYVESPAQVSYNTTGKQAVDSLRAQAKKLRERAHDLEKFADIFSNYSMDDAAAKGLWDLVTSYNR